MADDLNAPLGRQGQNKRRTALPLIVPKLIAGLLALSLAGFVLWAITAQDPLGGEPMAVAMIAATKPVPSKAADAAASSDKAGNPFRHDGEAAPPGAAADSKTVTIIDGTSGKRQEVVIPGGGPAAAPQTVSGQPPPPDPKLQEKSRHGQIPKIGPDGARPAEVYAHPLKLQPDQSNAPHIAVIVGRLGISIANTSQALAKLPAPVTFALAPYGGNAGRLAAQVRASGHEMLLQVPMEPFDYPDNDPGPQTLLTTLDAGQNVDRLHWLMSRFQGYVGIANYMGARFTASEPSLGPVLREASQRGLIYVDDGSSPRSVASQIAGANSLSFAKADVVIDAVPSAGEIDRALDRLEAIARQNGSAVGVASDLPVTIDRIAQWTKAAESRGFVLVPISMVANKAKSS